MPYTPTQCLYCKKPFKDSRGMQSHLRYIHPDVVADKPIVSSTKAQAREEGADVDLVDFFNAKLEIDQDAALLARTLDARNQKLSENSGQVSVTVADRGHIYSEAEKPSLETESLLPVAPTPLPPTRVCLPSDRWLQKNYPKTELPPGHTMCVKCNEDSYKPEPLAAPLCAYCRKFFA